MQAIEIVLHRRVKKIEEQTKIKTQTPYSTVNVKYTALVCIIGQGDQALWSQLWQNCHSETVFSHLKKVV